MALVGHFTPRNDPIPIVMEIGYAPWLVWSGGENLFCKGI